MANPGTPQIFGVPPIISGTGKAKATNFKFCTHILSIDRNRSPLQISGKVVGCVVRTLKTFQCTHIWGASRGLLCDSSAVFVLLVLHVADSIVDRQFCDTVYLPNLTFVALPIPEIIWDTSKIWGVPGFAHAPYSPKFLKGFCSH